MPQTLDLVSGVTTICRYAFDSSTIQKGLEYHRQGRVLNSNALVHKDNLHIHGTVRGSQATPYLIEARLYRKNAGLRIESICTCALGFACKHAVAAIADIFGKDGLRLFDVHRSRITLEEPEKIVEARPVPLPSHLSEWAESILAPASAPARPAAPAKTLMYLLQLSREESLRVQIMQCARLKSGGLGKAAVCRQYDLSDASTLPGEDLALLRELAGASFKSDAYVLRGAFGAGMIQRLIATGKCHWKFVRHDRPLKPGAPRAAQLEWEARSDGSQSPALRLEPPAGVFLLLDPPLYIDEEAGECGLIQSSHPPLALQRWISAQPLPPEQSRALAAKIKTLGLPAPREITLVERRNVHPTPVLHLMHIKLNQPIYDWRVRGASGIHALDLARFELDYDGTRIGYYDDREYVDIYREDRVERIHRDVRREDDYFRELDACGLVPADEVCEYGLPQEFADDMALHTSEEWLAFMSEIIPGAKRNGWGVVIDPDFRYQFAAVDDWYSQTTRDETVNDWFSLELGILVEGKQINLLPMIRGLLDQLDQLGPDDRRPEVLDIRLPDGRFVQLPAQRVIDIAKTLAELYDPAALVNQRLRLSRLRAAELIDITGTGQWKGDDELRQLAQRIHSYTGIAPVAAPAGLRATLRPYQLEGLAWLQFLREYSFGGILADDMGLGKTVEVLAHLLMEKESGRANLPSLVVAPTSLMANWRAETQRFAPDLRILVSHGGERKEFFEKLADYDLIVTSYSLLPRDEEILKKQPFHMVILDEAQYVKNPNTKWADVARSLSSRHRLCMTGTPMENHLGELWSLMTFLSPGYLGTQQQFNRAYRTAIEKRGDQERRRLLAQRLRPFILRRRKEEVALDLPPKTDITRTVELDGSQRDLYETIRLAMHERVRQEVARKGLDRSHIIILDALLKLRQACCDPRLVKLERAGRIKESAKLELLMDMVPEMIDEGRRILLFSQFTSMLDLIQAEIERRKIPFVRLDGSTADRETPVRRFQGGAVPLFLISLKAGGTGLNLTAADTVIHYDPWWNPAVEQQATDRAHRIGQEKPVFVYKLVTKGTVEEKIVAMQDRKRELVAGLLGDGSQQNLQLSKEDLDHLFDPL